MAMKVATSRKVISLHVITYTHPNPQIILSQTPFVATDDPKLVQWFTARAVDSMRDLLEMS